MCVALPYLAPSTTMSNPSPGLKPDQHDPNKDKIVGHDGMSDTIPPAGCNPQANKQGLTSKVLKFSFVYTCNSKHKVQPSVLHTHWMQAVKEAYGNKIVIINHENQNVKMVSTFKWTDLTIHAKHPIPTGNVW